MIKEKTCCGFIVRLCKKMCIKNSADSIKPDINAIQVSSKPFKPAQKQSSPVPQPGQKSTIIKGSSKLSIKNPSVGFVQTVETTEVPKHSEPDHLKAQEKSDSEQNLDNTVYADQIAQEVVMNMEEAYKIIKSDKEKSESELSQSMDSQKFCKVVKGLDFKSILAERSISEDSC